MHAKPLEATMTSEREIKEVVGRLRAEAEFNSAEPSLETEAAALITSLAAEMDEARALSRPATALVKDYEDAVRCIPEHHLLDPPDGGDVKLHEGITRYAAAEYARGKAEGLEQAAAKIDVMALAIEVDERDARSWGGPDPRGPGVSSARIDSARRLRVLSAAIRGGE